MRVHVLPILATLVLGVLLLSGVVLAENKVCQNNCKGTPGGETLKGDGSKNTLRGLGGRDYLYGLGAGDRVFGGTGDDEVHGGTGKDLQQGGSGCDSLFGNAGYDTLKGGEKACSGLQRLQEELLGGPGNDTIRANDGKKDIIRGGPGRDTAYVDPVDKVRGVEVERCPGGCNEPPVAKDDSYQLSTKNCNGPNSRPLTVDAPNGVLSNDTDADADPLKAVEVTPPTQGILLTLNADGSFTYEAYDGVCTDPDSFTYKTTDGAADSNVATVSLNPPNGP